mmetsp:Transcript_786/g.1932  ORF Transcript_786/g.1932 Transcript_786/m.1932 type:complete len:204 (-) Transcript_786:8-619(-)
MEGPGALPFVKSHADSEVHPSGVQGCCGSHGDLVSHDPGNLELPVTAVATTNNFIVHVPQDAAESAKVCVLRWVVVLVLRPVEVESIHRRLVANCVVVAAAISILIASGAALARPLGVIWTAAQSGTGVSGKGVHLELHQGQVEGALFEGLLGEMILGTALRMSNLVRHVPGGEKQEAEPENHQLYHCSTPHALPGRQQATHA